MNCDFNPPSRKPTPYRYIYLNEATMQEITVTFEFHTAASAQTFAEMEVPGLIFLRYERAI